jgi:cell wall-associated NlpC family hydrolase
LIVNRYFRWRNFAFFFFLIFASSCSIFQKKTKPKVESEVATDAKIIEKYSTIVGKKIDNVSLYRFVDQWIGTPYKYAGDSKKGIDCSHFVCKLMHNEYMFSENFYLTSTQLYQQGAKINLKNAKEGDIVCFSINQNSKVSHVGVYLQNNKFVHASTSKGVIISSLDEAYYQKRFLDIVRLAKK